MNQDNLISALLLTTETEFRIVLVCEDTDQGKERLQFEARKGSKASVAPIHLTFPGTGFLQF